MAKKKLRSHNKQHSPQIAKPKQAVGAEVVSNPKDKNSTPSRAFATVALMALIVTSTFALWKAEVLTVPAIELSTVKQPVPPKEQKAQPQALPISTDKTASRNPFEDLPEPPQYPTEMEYNASSGKFPPGALPPGVNLPGMNSYNAGMNTATMMDGRTTAQGYGVDNGIRQQFAGQIRDKESGLQYHGARYYNPGHGRFTSVDPRNAGAVLTDPQSWNGYSYAGNNPLKYIDPLGLWKRIACTSGGKDAQCYEAEEGDTYKTLASETWISSDMLSKFFGGQEITAGQVFT